MKLIPRPLLFAACMFLLTTRGLSADTLVLTPVQDNTIYQDNTSNSNGSGDFIFAGNNGGGFARRALVQFDLSALPAGATIESASVTMQLTQMGAGASDVSFHRLLSAWGESTSDAPGGEGGGTAAVAGDATWDHTFFDSQFWIMAGGDFVAAASATTNVDAVGSHTWTGLASDVQSWLDGGSSNFGWIVIGDEAPTGSSSNRFASRSNATAPVPSLTVEFSTIPEPSSLLIVAGCLGIALVRRNRVS